MGVSSSMVAGNAIDTTFRVTFRITEELLRKYKEQTRLCAKYHSEQEINRDSSLRA
jgi:hypothetical protein